MKTGVYLLFLLLFSLSFAFKDSDLDGVEDSKDKCPGTPILVLVDKYGCPIERPKGRFYLRVGASFLSNGPETRTALLTSLAYYYSKFYISFTTRYYVYSKLYGEGPGDSTVYGSYRFSVGNLFVIPGLRVRLPTGEEPFTVRDLYLTPSVILDLLLGRLDLFLYGGYTLREGRDLLSVSVGSGYDFTENLYVSLSYDTTSSPSGGNLSYVSAFLLFDLTRRVYATFGYSYGLEERAVDQRATFRIGIRF